METQKKNVYQKLQEARCKLLESKMLKSGKNNFAKFHYFELADILPVINPIMQELGLTTIISYSSDSATIKLVNCENPIEIIEVSTPLAEAGTKGCTPIQNIGSQQTYIRRYLYLTLFDIVEHDTLDAVVGDETKVIKLESKAKTKEIYIQEIKELQTLKELKEYYTKLPDEIYKSFGLKEVLAEQKAFIEYVAKKELEGEK